MDTEVGEEGESNTICERAASRRCCDGLLMNLIVVIIFFLLNCMYFVYGRFLTRNSIHFRLNNSLSRPSKKSVYYPLLGMKKLKNFSSLLAEAKQQLWESLWKSAREEKIFSSLWVGFRPSETLWSWRHRIFSLNDHARVFLWTSTPRVGIGVVMDIKLSFIGVEEIAVNCLNSMNFPVIEIKYIMTMMRNVSQLWQLCWAYQSQGASETRRVRFGA